MTSEQLAEWEAYDRLDPVGKWRDELAIASLISVVVNMAKDIYNDPKKGRPEYVSPSDFMIKWGQLEQEQEPEPKRQSVEDMTQVMLNIARASDTKTKKK